MTKNKKGVYRKLGRRAVWFKTIQSCNMYHIFKFTNETSRKKGKRKK